MRLTILGCRQGMPADGEASSAYLVTAGPDAVLLDCGPGAATALSRHTHPGALTAVVISHLHTDHCYDLLPLGKTIIADRMRDPRRFPTLPGTGIREWPPVPLFVPRGGRAALDALAAVFPVPTYPQLDRAFDLAFDVREYEPGTDVAVGDLVISMRPLRHSLSNCGIVVAAGDARLAYSGDTFDVEGLVPFARDVDMLLCEATLELPDDSQHGHLCATEAGAVAAAAGVGELVLTHFVTNDQVWLAARRADAQRSFAGPVHVAAPGLSFEVAAEPAAAHREVVAGR